jgi:RHS repeat-associated protein
MTTDTLGSTRLVMDAGGQVARNYDYLPFGEELGQGNGGTARDATFSGAGPRQKFTGKERDVETGMDYFGSRYFSGAQGRFTSPDPMVHPADSQSGFLPFISNPQDWNKYAYSLNNPLRYVDPDGQEPLPPAVRDLLMHYAPTALKAAGRVSEVYSVTQMILGLERSLGLMPPMVLPGPSTPTTEVQQAHAVARMTGNDVLLVDSPTNQGFDALQIVGGFMNARGAIPTELKGLSSANPMAVLSETLDTERAANGVTLPNGQALTGVQMFISAPNMNANAVANFANGGPLPTIVGRSSVSKVTITAGNGTVTIENKKVTLVCKKTGDGGTCQ